MSKPNMRTLLIPCAGGLPIDMQAEFGPVPAAALPIGGGIVLEKLLDQVVDHYDRILIAFAEQIPIVNKICKGISSKIEILEVGRTESIAATILRMADALSGDEKLITVQMGDAFHGKAGPFADSISVCEDRFNSRWITIRLGSDGLIDQFVLPGTSKVTSQDVVFAGKFSVDRPQDFFELLRAKCPGGVGRAESLYLALKEYFNANGKCPRVEAKDWQDFGYLKSYYHFRRTSGFNERQFNSVKFDGQRSTIIKTSSDRDKFLNEIRWYKQIPSDLAYLVPRIYKVQESDPIQVEMDYSAGIPLDQLWLYSRVDLDVWDQIWDHIKFTLDSFSERGKRDHPQSFAQASQQIYLDKTFERMKQYLSQTEFAPLTTGDVYINDRKAPNLVSIQTIIKEVASSEEFVAGYRPSILHGDLCFSNILYDSRLDKLTLIDPRGSFGVPGIFGDLRYDLAKLFHSSFGRYDFLSNGHFELNFVGNRYFLKEIIDSHQSEVGEFIANLIRDHSGPSYWQIEFVAGLLFLSMVPFHSEKPKSQMAFVLRGLELLQQALDLRGNS